MRPIVAALLSLVCALPLWAQTARIAGKVVSPTGAPIPNATVSLITPAVGAIASTRTDSNGEFRFTSLEPRGYVLSVQVSGLSERRLAVQADGASRALVIEVNLVTPPQEVTVTAERGVAEETYTAAQQVNVISASDLAERAKAVTAQAMQEEAGVALQRTSATLGGVFVRGLTGNRVNVYVDGVRYSTAAARGGINTFFNLNQASGLDAIEILRGPSSAQYGSDAVAGTVHLVGVAPSLSDATRLSGRYSSLAGSADGGYGSNLLLLLSSRRFGGVLNLDGYRGNRLRPGGGVDSHSAFTRFFGLPSDRFLGARLPDTAFTQYGGSLRLMWAPSDFTHLSASYSRSQQDGGRRSDQMLGGDGNLIADLRNLMTDFAYLRLDRYKLGPFERANLTYSYNAQREERVNQGGNGNPLAAITHEPERLRAHGVQGYLDRIVARNDLLLGAEYYDEMVRAPSFAFDPATGVSTIRRGRVPDRAAYRSGGIYLQDVFAPVEKLTFSGAARFSVASYRSRQADSPLPAGKPLWPDDSLRVSAVTWRAGVRYSPRGAIALFANFARGFRAPHITDLGTLGLTGSGFEVAAPDLAGMNATIGTSASRTASSSGLPVAQLRPEFSQSYDFGVRARASWISASFAAFINDIHDSITKQALILPPGAVGETVGGVPIVSQDPSSTVFVAASSSPVLVRANWDDARLWGLEHTANVRFNSQWSTGVTFTYIHAADRRTGLAPNFEGGTPAPDGSLTLRYSDRKLRWWLEPYLHLAGRQDRLSSLDLEDRRTGATRSRSSIQNFFRRGATARGYVGAGPDGVFGNADDFLLATGETLAQIQARVLGAANQAPLYDHIAGYATFNVRGGYRVGERHAVFADFENLADRNYRGISWGVDAPGRSLTLRYTVTF